MNQVTRVIGVDPGPTPGFVVLYCNGGSVPASHMVLQVSANAAELVFHALLAADLEIPTTIGIEKFVVGRRSSRSSSAHAGALTRAQIPLLREVFDDIDSTEQGRRGWRWFERPAATVKPWATDQRLEAAGLMPALTGMRHARDAARHALFASVHDCRQPDPLSTKAA